MHLAAGATPALTQEFQDDEKLDVQAGVIVGEGAEQLGGDGHGGLQRCIRGSGAAGVLG